jgi:hypothetical protein
MSCSGFTARLITEDEAMAIAGRVRREAGVSG